MTLAYDYPLLGVFWTMLEFFVLFAWIMALFYVIADLFRARDIGGFAKAVWAVFVIVAPFLGVFIYLLARGRKMAENQAIAVEEQKAAFDSYVRETAATAGPSDQLATLVDLRDSGAISAEEFEAGKAKILA